MNLRCKRIGHPARRTFRVVSMLLGLSCFGWGVALDRTLALAETTVISDAQAAPGGLGAPVGLAVPAVSGIAAAPESGEGGLPATADQDRPVLRVGVSGDYPPFTERVTLAPEPAIEGEDFAQGPTGTPTGTATGAETSTKVVPSSTNSRAETAQPADNSTASTETYRGFDIDVAKAFASDRGYRLEFVRFRWADLTTDLRNGRFDVAMSGVTIRPERALVGSWSSPVLTTEAIALVPAGARRERPMRQLDRVNVTVAVNAGGHLEQVARSRFDRARILAVADNSAVLMSLLDRSVDAVITDTVEGVLWQKIAPEAEVAGTLSLDRKGYLVAPGEISLSRELDAWLLEAEKSGLLMKLRGRHLEGASWRPTALPLQSLLSALDQRFRIAPWIADVKARQGLAVNAPEVEATLKARFIHAARAQAKQANLLPWSESSLANLLDTVFEISRNIQTKRLLSELDRSRRADTRWTLEAPLRPALARITESMARQVGLLQEPLRRGELHRTAKYFIRAPGFGKSEAERLSRALASLEPDAVEKLRERKTSPGQTGGGTSQTGASTSVDQ